MMKKVKKLLAVCCLACLLMSALSGCAALDEMRASQAFYDADQNILWDGAVYKPLPANEYFCPNTNGDRICVTEEDVPILLQEIFAKDKLYPNEDKMILESYYEYGAQYYCREDQYEELSKRLKAPFQPEMVCYTYWQFDVEKDEYVEEIYRLSDEEWGVLRKILETVEPMQVGEGWELAYDSFIYLKECSEDRLLRREFLELMCCGDTYYMQLNTGRERLIYQVPEEAVPHVAKIMEAEKRGTVQTEIIEEWYA